MNESKTKEKEEQETGFLNTRNTQEEKKRETEEKRREKKKQIRKF